MIECNMSFGLKNISKVEKHSRVSQGVVLGPILFSIFIKDFPKYARISNQIARLTNDTSHVKTSIHKKCQLQKKT